MHSQDGQLQDRISTVNGCQNRCDGNGLQSGRTCYSFDFDRQLNRCYLFYTPRVTTQPLISVDHYEKEGNCGKTTTGMRLLYPLDLQ